MWKVSECGDDSIFVTGCIEENNVVCLKISVERVGRWELYREWGNGFWEKRVGRWELYREWGNGIWEKKSGAMGVGENGDRSWKEWGDGIWEKSEATGVERRELVDGSCKE